MTMAAGLATLKYIDENRNEVYLKLYELGAKARAGLTKIFNEAKIDVQVTGEGSVFLTHFLNNRVRSIRNSVDAALSDHDLLYKYHMGLLALHQIFFLPSKMAAISSVHTTTDITHLLDATRSLVDSGRLTSEKHS